MSQQIITILTQLIEQHIKAEKREYLKCSKTKSSNYKEDDNDNTTDDENSEIDQIPFFIPYCTLLDQFYIATGYGWTPQHLACYGELRLFILQHPNLFSMHLPSDRVGLVALLPRSPQQDHQPSVYNNDLFLGTSIHLHKTIDHDHLDSDFHLEYHHQYNQSPQRQVYSNHNDYGQQQYSEMNRFSSPSHSASRRVPPITSLKSPLQHPSPTTTPHSSLPKSSSVSHLAPQQHGHAIDQHDLDEKMKNRGCAPQTNTGLWGPIWVVIVIISFYLLTTTLIEMNIVNPDSIAVPHSGVHRLILANERFVGDILKDVGLR